MANDFLSNPKIFTTVGGFCPGPLRVGGYMFSGNTDTDATALMYHGKNVVNEPEFNKWVQGTSAAPLGWKISGANATIARESTVVPTEFQAQGRLGEYSAKLTRAGADCKIEQNLLAFLPPPQNTIAYWKGRTILATCLVYATVNARAFIETYDGQTTTTSAGHGGSSTWTAEYTAPVAVHASATELTLRLIVKTGDTSGYFYHPVLIEAHQFAYILGADKAIAHTFSDPLPVDGLYLATLTAGSVQVEAK